MIEQHKLILEKCNDLLGICLETDKDSIYNILNKSKKIIDDYNNNTLSVIDITKKEEGKFSRFVSIIIANKYFGGWIHDETLEAVKSYIPPIHFKNQYILLSRKYNYWDRTKIASQIVEIIKTEILTDFQSKNKKIIIKFNKL